MRRVTDAMHTAGRMHRHNVTYLACAVILKNADLHEPCRWRWCGYTKDS